MTSEITRYFNNYNETLISPVAIKKIIQKVNTVEPHL